MTPALLLAILAGVGALLVQVRALARAVARVEAKKDFNDVLAHAKAYALAELEANATPEDPRPEDTPTSPTQRTLRLVSSRKGPPSGADEPTVYQPEGEDRTTRGEGAP
jgi:hypothetical protein